MYCISRFLIVASFHFEKAEEWLCTKHSEEAEYRKRRLCFSIWLSLLVLFSVLLPLLFQPLSKLIWRTPQVENYPDSKKCSFYQSKIYISCGDLVTIFNKWQLVAHSGP